MDFIALLAVLGFRLIGKEVYESKLNYFMATFLLLSTHIIISIRMIDTYNSVESKLVMIIINLVIGFVYFIAGGFVINVKKIITILICEVLQIVVLVLGTYLRL